MKKSSLLFVLNIIFIIGTIAQIPSTPISIDLTISNLHDKIESNGYNQTNGSVKKFINNNGIFTLPFDFIDSLKPYYMRFPGGEIANKYSRYHNNLGIGGGTLSFGSNYSSYYPDIFTDSLSINPEEKNNIIYPYMKIVNEKFSHSPKTVYVLNVVQHFKDGDQGHDVVKTGNEITHLTNLLSSSSSYIDLLNSSVFTDDFKKGINKNLDGIATLWSNSLNVGYIEYGNEIYQNRYSSDNANNPQIWDKNNPSSLEKYILICKLYKKILNEFAIIKEYDIINNPLKFSIPISGNVKVSYKNDPFISSSSGSSKYIVYFSNLSDKSFFDAVSPHTYLNEEFLTDYFNSIFFPSDVNKNKLFDVLYSGDKSFFTNLYKHYEYLLGKFPSKELWITEWNLKFEDFYIHKYYNTTSHLHFLHSFTKTIEKLNKNFGNKIPISLYHIHLGSTPNGDLNDYHLIEVSSSGALSSKPMYNYFNKVLNKINEFDYLVKNNPIENNSGLETDLYFNPNIETAGSCNLSKFLITYQNKNSTGKQISIDDIVITNSFTYKYLIDSIYPIKHYNIQGTTKGAVPTTNLETTIDSLINVPPFSVGYIEIYLKDHSCSGLRINNYISNDLYLDQKRKNLDYHVNGSLIVYPNPISNNIINFLLNSSAQGKANIQIHNVLGAEVYSTHSTLSSENQIILSNKLPAGRYSIRIEQNNQAQFGSFIVVE